MSTTKHAALQSILRDEKQSFQTEIKELQRQIEMLQEQVAEAREELRQYPSDQDIEESTYQELAASVETHGIVVPDVLLVEDDTDDGTRELTNEELRNLANA